MDCISELQYCLADYILKWNRNSHGGWSRLSFYRNGSCERCCLWEHTIKFEISCCLIFLDLLEFYFITRGDRWSEWNIFFEGIYIKRLSVNWDQYSVWSWVICFYIKLNTAFLLGSARKSYVTPTTEVITEYISRVALPTIILRSAKTRRTISMAGLTRKQTEIEVLVWPTISITES